MGNFAVIADVKTRFEGELPASQTAWVEARIGDAEALLRLKVPSLAKPMAGLSPVVVENARRVVVDAVLRLLRNPMGARDQTVGPFRVTYDSADVSAQLYFTDAELAVFAPSQRRFGMVGIARPRWVG